MTNPLVESIKREENLGEQERSLIGAHPYDILQIGKNVKEAKGEDKDILIAIFKKEFF